MIYSFGDCEIDIDRRELRKGGAVVHVEPQVFDLLVHFVRHSGRVVSKDELVQAIWDGRIVSDATLTSRISAARRAIDDDAEQQHFIRTIARRGYLFDRIVRERESSPADLDASQSSLRSNNPNADLQQEITFCQAADGVHLAMATVGSGRTLVKTANWLNHLEYDWRSPIWAPLFRRLAAQCRFARYDERGNGLSDWQVPRLSFDAFVHDLETVVDALGLGRFALLGMSQGAPVAIAYAVRHPERVSRLILSGGFAQGWRRRGNAADIARAEASITLIRQGWGQDNPAARQMFTSLIVPDATLEEMRWFNDLERVSATPDNAIRLLHAIGDIDILELLPKVSVPTLVLHSRGDSRVPFEHGLLLARTIPNARFVALESRNHLLLSHEAAWPRYVNELCSFLKEPDATSGTSTPRKGSASELRLDTKSPWLGVGATSGHKRV
jgi:DNA-binding winged helix-turn-helix (wHTH) protein/alpha-beta hydrolase superfamily lysophospholipase